MKRFLLIFLVLSAVVWACQDKGNQSQNSIVIANGKLRVLTQNVDCGKQFVIITDSGERLTPVNMQDFYDDIQENAEIQLIYTELSETKSDTCCLGRPIRISSISLEHTSMR